MDIFVIGAGGVGSWLVASLSKLVSPAKITLCDGDALEERNLDRQFFTHGDVGKLKAAVLGDRYGLHVRTHWYSADCYRHARGDMLICCADNNPARLAALAACDTYGCNCIVGANETRSAEAYFYAPHWKDTARDPRVYFPEILANKSGDPRARSIGCMGEPQRDNPQLVSSNFMAAALIQHLFLIWTKDAPALDRETIAMLPYRLTANRTKLENYR